MPTDGSEPWPPEPFAAVATLRTCQVRPASWETTTAGWLVVELTRPEGQPAPAPRFSRTVAEVERSAPWPGQHTDEALGDWGSHPADPFNDHEPVDSSAAAIAAQGLLRLGHVIQNRGGDGGRYQQAGLHILDTLFDAAGPYLATDPKHEGLILHSIYHRPNNWDHVPHGSRIPRGESSQWGDYHAREAALYVLRLARDEPYLTFFGR